MFAFSALGNLNLQKFGGSFNLKLKAIETMNFVLKTHIYLSPMLLNTLLYMVHVNSIEHPSPKDTVGYTLW